MNSPIDFSLTFSTGGIWIFAGVLLLFLISWYYYKLTVPPVSKPLKYTLIFLRFIGITLIFILLFSPKINYTVKKKVLPINYIFVDNSVSMVNRDSVKREKEVKAILQKLTSDEKFKSEIFLFDKRVHPFFSTDFDSIRFNGNTTNFERLFNKINSVEDSVANIVLITDGNPTEGMSPNNEIRNISIPVFTVGIGDTATPPNIEIGHLLTNRTVYKGNQTPVEVSVLSTGVEQREVFLSIFVNGKLSAKQKIVLNPEGITKTKLSYTPEKLGVNRLKVVVGRVKGESSFADNSKMIYVNVLKKKKQILFITSSPSSDFEFAKRAVLSDSNYSVSQVIEYSKLQQIDFNAVSNSVSSAESIFLINFPTSETDSKLWRIISSAINKGKPYFLQISSLTDIPRLQKMGANLPLQFTGKKKIVLKAQPVLTQRLNPLFEFPFGSPEEIWNTLPPINFVKTDVKISKASSTLLAINVSGKRLDFPMLISSNSPDKSLILFAEGFWKWKLSTSLENAPFFDSFFINSVKWLTNRTNKGRVNVYLSKEKFNRNETVYAGVEVFDKLYNSATNAYVTGTITDGKSKSEVIFNEKMSGLFEAKISKLLPGKYSLNVVAKRGNEIIKGKANFTVTNFNSEKLNLPVNKNFLSEIARETDGRFVLGSKADEILQILNQNSFIYDKKNVVSLLLFPSEYLLFFIIFTFAVEWFLRKIKSLL